MKTKPVLDLAQLLTKRKTMSNLFTLSEPPHPNEIQC